MGLFRRAAIDQVEAPARDRQVIQQDLAQLREQEGEINRRRAALGVQHNQAYAIGDREIIDGLRESQAGLGAELEQVRAQVQHLQQELQAEADNARQEWACRCAHLVDGLAMERMAKLRECEQAVTHVLECLAGLDQDDDAILRQTCGQVRAGGNQDDLCAGIRPERAGTGHRQPGCWPRTGPVGEEAGGRHTGVAGP